MIQKLCGVLLVIGLIILSIYEYLGTQKCGAARREIFRRQSLNVDVSSFEITKKEALKNLREALELFFEGTASKQFAILS